MKNGWRCLSVSIMLLVLSGCRTPPPKPAVSPAPAVSAAPRVTAQAPFAKIPVKVDGILDDPVWQSAPTLPLTLSRDAGLLFKSPLRETVGDQLRETGEIRFAWDRDFVYVAARFVDSDVVAEGPSDQLHHYQEGDVLELFLQPEGRSWYWEFQAAPTGKKTHAFFPGRGRIGLKSPYAYACDGMKTAVAIAGTLNAWEDRDTAWAVEVAIPVKALTERGDLWGPESRWRVLVSRYNYSRYLPMPEWSVFPRLSNYNFHLHEEYVPLEMLP